MWHVTEMKHVFLYKLLGKIITDYRKELQGRKVRSNKKNTVGGKGKSLQAVKYNWYKRKCHTLYAQDHTTLEAYL